jgi:outer membrane immunogenic protein
MKKYLLGPRQTGPGSTMKPIAWLVAVSLAALGLIQNGLVQNALAADLARPAPIIAQPSWTGVYLGFHAGYGWASNETGSTTASTLGLPAITPISIPQSSDGSLAGLQLGYNWQFANAWVAGIEGDASGTGLKASQSTPASGAGCVGGFSCNLATMSERVDWLATARGRLGYLVGPGLAYVTGGAAFGGVNFSANAATTIPVPGTLFPATLSSVRAGWVVGAGYEAMLTSNWSLRGEFLHYFLNGVTTTAAGLSPGVAAPPGTAATYAWNALDINIVRLGLNYKF